MSPTKKLDAPKVALVPTDQYTFAAIAPLTRIIDEWSPVTNVLAVCITHIEDGTPFASNVSDCHDPRDNVPDAAQYTPGPSVTPDKSDDDSLVVHTLPAAAEFSIT